MSSASIKKIIPCKKEQLVEMVLDIEKYPEFVPWCIEGKVFDRNESADLITFNGDLKVGKSILNETFSSHVSYFKEIIYKGLERFIEYQILQFDDFSSVEIHYVGSIAYYLKDEITRVGAKYNLTTGKFVKRPIDGLVEYHKRNIIK